MIVNDILKIILKEFPDKHVVRIADYDSNYYIFFIVTDYNSMSSKDEWYGFSKKDNSIVNYTPSINLIKHFEAVNKRTIYKKVSAYDIE